MAAKNVFDTVDERLRGGTAGELTPEGQSLWDNYNNLYGAVQNIPNRTLTLRSGATTQIPDPGALMRQKALLRILLGMNNSGLGTRAKPEPGFLGQMAPFITALGTDPKFQKWLGTLFADKGTNLPSVGMTGEGNWDLGGIAEDPWANYDPSQFADWEW